MQQLGQAPVSTRSAKRRYGLALFSTALTLALRFMLGPVLGEQAPLLLFILPVFFSALYGGLGPGLLATSLSAILGVYFFVVPVVAVGPLDLANMVRVSIFIVEGILISFVSGRLQTVQRQVTTQQADLQASEDRFRLLVEGVRDYAIFMLDPNGRVVSWNAGAEQITGYHRDKIIGQHFSRLYTPDALADKLPQRELDIAAKTGLYEGEGWRVRKDGSCFWANTVLTAIRDETGQIKGFAKVTRDITERKQDQEALLKQTAILQEQADLLDLAHEAIMVHDIQTGALTYWNNGAAALYGWSKDEALENTPDHLLQTQYPQPESNIKDELLRIGHWEGELTHRRKNGTSVVVDSRWAIKRDEHGEPNAILETNRDTTTRKHAEERLRTSQARLAGIIGSAMDALISIDSKQQIVVFNGAAERMFGYGAEQVLSQPLDRLLPESARIAHRQHIPAFGQTGVTTRSMHALRPLSAVRANGEEFPIEATISQVESYGEKLYTVIIRDITERMRSEAERTQLLEAERVARAEAEAAVHTRDVFLSIAAHELRTPLTALLGHTHLLERRAARDRSLPEREMRGLTSITEQATRLNRLIEALLDVSRIQLGRFQLQQQVFDLSKLVMRVVEELRPSLERHTLEADCPSTLMIFGDEVRLEQVLQNLLSNAVKYSPHGGAVRVCVELHAETLSISVRDQGIGIPDSALPQLFSQFFRATNVDPKRISGLGIGLYVVKEIVNRHGGNVTVESTEGQGTTFTVRLPQTAGTISA